MVIQIILARLLLPADFGNLAIILALVNYFAVFVQSGLTAAVIQKKEISQLDINTLFTISISIAACLFLIVYFSAPLIVNYYDNEALLNPIRVTSIVLFLYSYNSIQMGILSRRMEFKKIFICTAIATPLSGAIGIYLAYCGFGLWALIANFILNILFLSIVMAFGLRMKVFFQFSWESAKSLYSFSLKIMGANLLSGFGDFFRTMAIGKHYSKSELAYYDRAYTYSLVVMQVITNSLQSVLLPVFSRKQEDILQLKELSRKSIRVTSYLVTPLLLGTAIVAKPLILLLLTEKWLPIVPFFMLFCVFRWAGCIVGIDKQVILALGKSSLIMYFEAFLLIANIVVLLIAIPISIKAIAIGAFVVEYVGFIVIVLIGKMAYNYSLHERLVDLYKPIINSIIMALVMWSIGRIVYNPFISLLIQLIAGVLVYILMSSLTKDNSYNYIKSIVQDKINHKDK